MFDLITRAGELLAVGAGTSDAASVSHDLGVFRSELAAVGLSVGLEGERAYRINCDGHLLDIVIAQLAKLPDAAPLPHN